MKSGYAPINGLELYYEIHGEGNPLILLHGVVGSLEMFRSGLLPELAKKHKVIAVDMQGHGHTADIDRPLSAELIADDITGLMNYLEIGKADFVGYSFGGNVSLQVAIKNPELVDKLVVISTPVKRTGFYPDILKQQEEMGPESAEFLKQIQCMRYIQKWLQDRKTGQSLLRKLPKLWNMILIIQMK